MTTAAVFQEWRRGRVGSDLIPYILFHCCVPTLTFIYLSAFRTCMYADILNYLTLVLNLVIFPTVFIGEPENLWNKHPTRYYLQMVQRFYVSLNDACISKSKKKIERLMPNSEWITHCNSKKEIQLLALIGFFHINNKWMKIKCGTFAYVNEIHSYAIGLTTCWLKLHCPFSTQAHQIQQPAVGQCCHI